MSDSDKIKWLKNEASRIKREKDHAIPKLKEPANVKAARRIIAAFERKEYRESDRQHKKIKKEFDVVWQSILFEKPEVALKKLKAWAKKK